MRPPSLTLLVLLSGLSVLALNMFLPSLVQMAEEFGVSYAVISLSMGGFLILSAFVNIIVGPLSDMYGRRPVMLWGVGIFTAASAGCYFATNVWVFLALRAVQASVGVGMVLSRAVVRDTSEREEAARLLGVVGTSMALAPLLGPMLGGYLDEWFGWRASFLAYVLMGLAAFALSLRGFGETNTERAESFGAQFRSYPELLGTSLFWAYAICLVFSNGAFFGFLGGAALVGEGLFGLTPSQVGLGLGSISGGFMLGNILTSRLSGRVAVLKLMLAGRISASVGPLVGAALLSLGAVHPVIFFGGAMFVGLGNGLTLPGANAGVMSVNPRLAGSASGLSGALTVLGGALAAAFTGAFASGSAGAYVMLGFLSFSSFIGLLATLWAMKQER